MKMGVDGDEGVVGCLSVGGKDRKECVNGLDLTTVIAYK